MVVGAFPAAKLGALLLRQISKPIANYLKEKAKTTPLFRTYICMPPAQFYNWCEVKTKMWILNLGKPVNIPVLNEAMAIELGANLLGEAVIFIIAAGVLISEYSRSYRKEAAKEAAKQEEMNALNTELQELFFQMEEQRVQMKELLRVVSELESRVITKPHNSGTKNENNSQKPPRDSDTSSMLPATKDSIKNISTLPYNSKQVSDNKSSTLIMKAIEIVEHDFLNYNSQHNPSVLTSALNYLYKDIYKLPSTVN